MSVLLETTLGDVVIDLDITGSPNLSLNFLKLVKARYYTNCLIYNIVPNRYCLSGDPRGDGSGGGSIYGHIESILNESNKSNDIIQSPKRFIRSSEGIRELREEELREKGIVSAIEMNQIKDTIGSQFLISLQGMSLEGLDDRKIKFFSLGTVVEDDNDVLEKLNRLYCDKDGRPYTDVRIIRALIVHDPFPDPDGLYEAMQAKGITFDERSNRVLSPDYRKPKEEIVEPRISATEAQEALEEEEHYHKNKEEQEEFIQQKEAKSRAVVLEMLGDLPDADITPPENVLFICKLNPVTEEDDLELIFSRFDEKVRVDIIRDEDTGQSLNYAFAEFTTKEQCVEAYFKMNNALVDDRRIKVDFSQSVSRMWNNYHRQKKHANALPTSKRYTHSQAAPPDYSSTSARHDRSSYSSRPRNDENSLDSLSDGSRECKRYKSDRDHHSRKSSSRKHHRKRKHRHRHRYEDRDRKHRRHKSSEREHR